MGCAIGALPGTLLASLSAMGCGLDWTLPRAHFEGVEEHGYVAYWETIGEIDLGDKMVLPVHIGFNSHREASSSVLGKGWIVALLESHVEPIDENTVNVIMPDGWTFLFLRNGNSETWRGNSGWMGETNDSIFTISAPCGWKIKYDRGKIQEIDGNKIGSLTFSYNGGVPTEIDREGTPLLQVVRDPASGTADALIIDGKRVEFSLAQRPRIVSLAGRNLVEGLDPSLASLQLPDGEKESFSFGTDSALNPTLTLSKSDQAPRAFVWDVATRQIKSDGQWAYTLLSKGNHLRLTRVSPQSQSECYEADEATGMTAEKAADGAEITTYRFVSGPLAGSVRKVEQLDSGGKQAQLYSASYYPSGQLMREIFSPDEMKTYSDQGQLLKETIAGQVIYEQDLDSQGRVIHVLDATRHLEVKTDYETDGSQKSQVFQQGKIFFTETIDRNNKLTSITEGEQ